jgi:hypothetical protein
MRSRAFTAGCPFAAAALRYACHVLLDPAAVASVWQMRSAPAIPPRFAPLPEPALVMKNDMGGGGAAGGCCAIARYEPPTSAKVRPTPNVRAFVLIIDSLFRFQIIVSSLG